jgi:hypothetical protein
LQPRVEIAIFFVAIDDAMLLPRQNDCKAYSSVKSRIKVREINGEWWIVNGE